MKTVVTYNGVTIQYAEVLSFSSVPILDESGTTYEAIRHTMTLKGLVRGSNQANATTFVEALVDYQKKLTEPRKALVVRLDDAGPIWIDVDPSGAGTGKADAYNGPFPQVLEFTKMVSGRAAMVNISITWTQTQCTVAPAILNHRWEQVYRTDDRNYGARVVTGQLTLSTGPTIANANPDLFRYFVWPPQIPGWRRTRAEFVISSDHRQLRYTIEDEEGFRPFPGAFRGDASFRIRNQLGKITKSMNITLEGTKGDNPGAILDAAWVALRKRITTDDTILWADVTEDLFANRVTIAVEALGPQAANTDLLPAAYTMFGPITNQVPEGTNFRQPTPYGVSLIRAAQQAIFDPCTQGNPANAAAMVKAGFATATAVSLTAPSELMVDAATFPALPMSPRAATISSAQAGDSPYLSVEHYAEIDVENNIVVLSPAKRDAAARLHQTSPPRVIIRHHGRVERLRTQPVVATPVKPSNGYIENWRVRPATVEQAGSRAEQIFAAIYSYEVVLWQPASGGGFSDEAISGQGTFRRYTAGTAAWESNPSTEAPAALTVPTGYGI